MPQPGQSPGVRTTPHKAYFARSRDMIQHRKDSIGSGLSTRRHATRHPSVRRRLGLDYLEDRLLLAPVRWDGGGDGASWTDALNWDTNLLPGSADDAVIGAAFSGMTIRQSVGTTSVHSVTSEAALDLAGGTFTVNTALDAGKPVTLRGATLAHATLVARTTLQGTSGTLDGVIVNGNLDLASASNTITVTGGMTLNTALQLGAADGSTFGRLFFNGSQTLDGSGTVTLGPSSTNFIGATTSSATLTLGSAISIHATGGTLGG